MKKKMNDSYNLKTRPGPNDKLICIFHYNNGKIEIWRSGKPETSKDPGISIQKHPYYQIVYINNRKIVKLNPFYHYSIDIFINCYYLQKFYKLKPLKPLSLFLGIARWVNVYTQKDKIIKKKEKKTNTYPYKYQYYTQETNSEYMDQIDKKSIYEQVFLMNSGKDPYNIPKYKLDYNDYNTIWDNNFTDYIYNKTNKKEEKSMIENQRSRIEKIKKQIEEIKNKRKEYLKKELGDIRSYKIDSMDKFIEYLNKNYNKKDVELIFRIKGKPKTTTMSCLTCKYNKKTKWNRRYCRKCFGLDKWKHNPNLIYFKKTKKEAKWELPSEWFFKVKTKENEEIIKKPIELCKDGWDTFVKATKLFKEAKEMYELHKAKKELKKLTACKHRLDGSNPCIIICENCGEESPLEAIYCSMCGEKLND